jgi:hypothetical protein
VSFRICARPAEENPGAEGRKIRGVHQHHPEIVVGIIRVGPKSGMARAYNEIRKVMHRIGFQALEQNPGNVLNILDGKIPQTVAGQEKDVTLLRLKTAKIGHLPASARKPHVGSVTEDNFGSMDIQLHEEAVPAADVEHRSVGRGQEAYESTSILIGETLEDLSRHLDEVTQTHLPPGPLPILHLICHEAQEPARSVGASLRPVRDTDQARGSIEQDTIPVPVGPTLPLFSTHKHATENVGYLEGHPEWIQQEGFHQRSLNTKTPQKQSVLGCPSSASFTLPRRGMFEKLKEPCGRLTKLPCGLHICLGAFVDLTPYFCTRFTRKNQC